MNVVKFPRLTTQAADGWQSAELQQFLAVSANAIAAGEASGWEVGVTENGDPQVFLLGPPPDQKRFALFEGGHIPRLQDIIREMLDWLDKYLGPVTTA